ncbi:MAG TPA: Hsp20/alpha crystallin family protein [Candidatus Polarisedimenticolia bacterium]|nr:Hsp20/alpha crystallin family protein [Candidatus Polarisedimenticolia bacterium]
MSGRAPRSPRGTGTPIPWDPIRDLIGLKERMNRLLESVLRRGDFSTGGLAGWSPTVDLREDREAFVLIAEVPGVSRDDLEIRVEGGIVTVEGRRPLEQEARSALRIERPYGSFTRTFHLPNPVDEGRVTARLHLGVLEIVLPKSSGARARSIQVQVR